MKDEELINNLKRDGTILTPARPGPHICGKLGPFSRNCGTQSSRNSFLTKKLWLMDLVASDSAQQDLSGTVGNFKICGRTWKIGDPIHTVGIGAIQKKR